MAYIPKKSSPGNSGAGALYRELRLEVALEAIATEDDALEELRDEEMGYDEAVGRGWRCRFAIRYCLVNVSFFIIVNVSSLLEDVVSAHPPEQAE